jgi:hypothetical protein
MPFAAAWAEKVESWNISSPQRLYQSRRTAPAGQHNQSRVIDSLIESGQKKQVVVGAEMDTQLSQDKRRAVAQRIFAALCAHYPDRYIALFEHPQIAAASPDQVLTTSATGPAVQGGRDGTEGASR